MELSSLKKKRKPKFSTWVQFQKWQNDLNLFPRQIIQHHSNPNLCLNHWCQRSRNWPVLWRPTTPCRTNTKKKVVLFIIGDDWNAKVGCQELLTKNNRQVWCWKTKWNRSKANRVLLSEHIGHSNHLLTTTQEMSQHMDIIIWSMPKSDWLGPMQSEMEKLYTVSKS